MILKFFFLVLFLLLFMAIIGPKPLAAAPPPAGDSEVIVMVAPSVNDDYYAPVFEQIIAYDVLFVNTVRQHTNVVLVVDSATMSHVQGKVPEANIIEATVNDIWARDVAPISPNHPVKLSYRPQYLDTSTAAWIEDSFNEWTDSLALNFTSSNLVLDGGNFVHNGADKAIITTRVFNDNPNLTPEQVDQQLRELTGVTTIAYIPEEALDTTGHADGMVMWVDGDILLVNEFEEPFRSQVLTPLQTAFPDVRMIEIPVDYTHGEWQGFISACGLHVNSLVTDSHIFLATYGQDNDAVVQSLIEAQTDKTVVPINAENVCFMGGAVRCLTWYVKEDHAETIIRAANPYPTAVPLDEMSVTSDNSGWQWGGLGMLLLVGSGMAITLLNKK